MDEKPSFSFARSVEEARKFIEVSSRLYYHNISLDIVIIGYHERSLKVLLEKPEFSECEWMLPGGYIRRNQTVEEAAKNVAHDRTRLKDLSLQQYKVYSTPGRTWGDKNNIRKAFEKAGILVGDDFWMFDNFVSIGFFALTEYSKVEPSGDFYSEECRWFSLDELPPLIFDHRQMIDDALQRLRHHIVFHPIGYSLLPDKFTLPEIHSLYETILGKKLDARNFAKKLTNLGIIVKTRETRNIGAHRSPYLYMFDKTRYDALIRQNEALIL
jgi:ADP-ribose pyrophosphatase YjhB (NUDIX family)